jgi:hypothetical protein
MKITDPQIIQTEEKKLIVALQQHLDHETVKTVLMDRIAETVFEPKEGQIVVHDNQIAFRLDFDLKFNGSLLFDRQGNYIADPPGSPSLLNPAAFENDTTRLSESPENELEDLSDDENQKYPDLLPDDETDENAGNVSAEDSDTLDDKDVLDDDIDDILNESREFWNQKKGS